MPDPGKEGRTGYRELACVGNERAVLAIVPAGPLSRLTAVGATLGTCRRRARATASLRTAAATTATTTLRTCRLRRSGIVHTRLRGGATAATAQRTLRVFIPAFPAAIGAAHQCLIALRTVGIGACASTGASGRTGAPITGLSRSGRVCRRPTASRRHAAST
jgi:hypothetical protein